MTSESCASRADEISTSSGSASISIRGAPDTTMTTAPWYFERIVYFAYDTRPWTGGATSGRRPVLQGGVYNATCSLDSQRDARVGGAARLRRVDPPAVLPIAPQVTQVRHDLFA